MTLVMQTGICLYDSSGFICSWSNTAQQLMGYLPQEVIGQPINVIFTMLTEQMGPQTMVVMTKDEGRQSFIVEKSEPLNFNNIEVGVISFVLEAAVVDDPYSNKGELHRDQQSGVYDSESIRSILSHEARMTIRYKQALSLVLVQINGYEDIDGIHGNGSTDLIVQTLAIILKNETRDVDSIGRISNDLFLICLPSTKEKAAFHVASRIARVALRYSDDETPFTINTFCNEMTTPVEDWMVYVQQLVNR